MKHMHTSLLAGTLMLLAASTVLAAAAGAVPQAPATTPTVQELGGLLADVASDDIQKRANAQKAIEVMAFNASRPGAETERVACAHALAAKLGPQTPAAARVWLLRQLQWMGRAEVVPAVAGLLADKDPLIVESARRALQHNPSPEAAAALRAAMAKGGAPEWRVALINTLGARQDAAGVAAIATALADKDETVAAAAAAALGKIGGAEAAKALGAAKATVPAKLRSGLIDAYLLCADQLLKDGKKDEAAAIYQEMYAPTESNTIRIAALRGLVLAKGEQAMPLLTAALTGKDERLQAIAVSLAQEMPGPGATKALIGLMPQVPPTAQAALLNELGRRGDAAALPAVLDAAKNKEPVVRAAAFRALGTLGGAAEVGLLAQAAATADPAEADAARASLAALRGPTVNQAILAALPQGDPKVRAELIRCLAARKAAEAAPALLKATADADASVRVESLKALDALADDKCLPALIGLLAKAAKGEEYDSAEKAILSICSRSANKDACFQAVMGALARAPMPARGTLLKALCRIGGTKALGPIRAAVADADPLVKEAGVRALADWPDGAAAPDLLAIAQTDPKQTNAVLALRGYIRLAGLTDRPAAEKIKMCQDALAAAKRPDEKKQVLGVLGDVNLPQALQMVGPMLEEPALKGEAAVTATKIAKGLGGNLPPETKAMMEAVLVITKDKRVVKDAEDVLKRIKPPKK